MSERDEKHLGLIDKYDVTRRDDPEGKHDHCRYFVLDPEHDPIAREALAHYAARAANAGYQVLCDDLTGWLTDIAAIEAIDIAAVEAMKRWVTEAERGGQR